MDYFDAGDRGFGCRVGVGGSKSWFVKYVYHGKQRRITVGRYPATGLAEARKLALAVKHGVSTDIDPAGEKQARRAAPTLRQLASEYLERHAKKKKRSWREDERIINKYLKDWHDRRVADITRREVIALLDDIADRAPAMANRVLSLIRKLFNFGLKRERVATNPAQQIDKPGHEVSRDRIYDQDEIRRLWAAFEGTYGGLYKLILITGQRQAEVAGMRWQELDLEKRIWTVPAERMKSKCVHMVPLSDLAVEVLASKPPISTEYVFASPRKHGGPISSFGDAAIRVKRISGIPDFRSHDLRRTCGSGITALGFSRFIMDRVLGHLEPGVGARYDRHDYQREKSAALGAWRRHLQEILSGGGAGDTNVVSIKDAQ